MSDLLEKTQDLYNEYAKGNTNLKEELLVTVNEYIKPTVKSILKSYHDPALVEEVISDVTIFLLDGGIEKYDSERAASFAVYCASIAKNKAINRFRRLILESEHAYEVTTSEDDQEIDFYSVLEDKSHWGNPEKEYLNKFVRSEIYNTSRTVIDLFLNDTGKPYMTVGAGYAIVLFNYLAKGTKILASPQWAYEQLYASSVEEGGNSFVSIIRKVLNETSVKWCDDYIDQLEDEDKDTGTYLGELVFGNEFQKKDFENWTSRYKAKMLKKMLEMDISAKEILE